MNANMLAKFVKSKYKNGKAVFHLIFDSIVLTAELIFCAVLLLNKFGGNSENVTNLTLYLILGTAYFYVLLEIAYIKSKQKRLDLKPLQYHHNYIRRGELALITVAGIIAVLIILAVKNGKIYSEGNSYGLYIWYMAMIGLAWTDGYYVKAAALFGGESYCSGKYEINYGSITDVREISKRVAGIGFYEIYLVEIYGGGKLLGIDKLFSEEYGFLLEKINRQKN